MAKNDRFVKVYSQSGFTTEIQIWVDQVTGVNYLYQGTASGGGLTPLLNRDGTPVISAIGAKPE